MQTVQNVKDKIMTQEKYGSSSCHQDVIQNNNQNFGRNPPAPIILNDKFAPLSSKANKGEAASINSTESKTGTRTKTFAFEFGGGRFSVSDSGVEFIGAPDKDGNVPDPKWICSKLTVEAMTRDGSSESWGRLLQWYDADGVRHEWLMPMDLLQGDGAEMRRELSGKGVTIAPGKASRDLLAPFLQVYPVEVRARCVDCLGWYGNLYVTPNQVIGDSEEKVVFQNAHAVKPAFASVGTVDEWRSGIGVLALGNSRLLFGLSAAFAAPLLDIFNEESGGFNFKGNSSSGKSTILKVAASVWGSPDKYPRLWRATGNGLEGLAALHNDGILILDELGQIDPKEAGDVAYMLANGQGKVRASKAGTARASSSWRLLFLSSGEVGIATLMAAAGKEAKAGQEIRLADIPADAGAGMGCFENIYDMPTPAAFAMTLKERALKSHGAVGLKWLEYVVQNRINLAEQISAGIRDFVADVVPTGAEGQIERLARRFGIVAVAGEIASQCELTGWQAGAATEGVKRCFAAWLVEFGGPGNREERSILDHVKHFFEAHGSSRFESLEIDKDQRIVNRAGFVRGDGRGNFEYLVLPEVFKKELCKGFDPKQVAEILKTHKWIVPGGDGRASRKTHLSGSRRIRVYVFTDTMWS